MILTGEDGKQYELVIGDVLEANSPKKYMLIEPLPTPPAKEAYTIEMWQVQSGLNKNVAEHHLDLTPDAAEVLSKAIEALLIWLQDKHGEDVRAIADGTLLDVYKAMNKAAEAIQDGSDYAK